MRKWWWKPITLWKLEADGKPAYGPGPGLVKLGRMAGRVCTAPQILPDDRVGGAKGQASADHTTLLLNCYTKLKDVDKLDQFLRGTDGANLPFDSETAVKVTRPPLSSCSLTVPYGPCRRLCTAYGWRGMGVHVPSGFIHQALSFSHFAAVLCLCCTR